MPIPRGSILPAPSQLMFQCAMMWRYRVLLLVWKEPGLSRRPGQPPFPSKDTAGPIACSSLDDTHGNVNIVH